MRFENVSRSELLILIEEWIHNERDRNIMRRRILDGIVYEKLAEEFELSVPQVKTIVYKNQSKILKHM
jgi:hypothetical protein